MNYLITGAGRGIGRGLTRSLLSQGHRVFLVDNNTSELQNTLSLAPNWVSSTKPNLDASSKNDPTKAFSSRLVDLADRSAVKAVVQEMSAFFNGRLDVLVNNAFPLPHTWLNDAGMEDQDDEDSIMAQWDQKLAVGLTAPFLLSRLCVPLLNAARSDRAGPGCIINVSSSRWKQAEDNHEAYSAAKAGLQGLTQSMCVSLGHRYGIRVNAISPGWVHVGEQKKEADEQGTKWEDDLTEGDHKWHPAGRVGRIEDIARAVAFLVDNQFVTGQDIVVDGGVGRKMVYPE